MSTKIANDRTFGVFVSNHSHIGKVLVVFYENDNPDCEKLFEMIAGLSTVYSVVKVNKNDSTKMVRFFRVETYPTLILFKKGKPVSRIDGLPVSDVQVVNFTNEAIQPKPQVLKTKTKTFKEKPKHE